VTRQQVQDRVEGIPSYFSDFFFGDLGKGQSGRALQIDIIRKGEGGKCSEGGAGEEVCSGTV
jgi:hypothetical protein